MSEKIGFKRIALCKDETLGIGAYGVVYQAKCDDLLCAAKIIHPTLFNPTTLHQSATHSEHSLPFRRFQLECEFLSTVRHPNIVQYLGVHQDSDTGLSLPVLLMELMDNNLIITVFLESSTQPIPHNIQVNICHDIALALSFLHSNRIIHRDLSSNNVLLTNYVKAKVTDFGMAKLSDQMSLVTQHTFTMCPGTDVYMPPEAVKANSAYTEKIDCFSFGVITIQIITQQFPNPVNRRKEIQVDQPGLPPTVEVPVSEIERRQNHIDEIDPHHPLLPVALDCLNDADFERPTAHHLCERIAGLKQDPRYSESVRLVEARSSAEQSRSDEELQSLRHEHGQQVQSLQLIIQSQANQLTKSNQALREKDDFIAELTQRNQRLEREKGIAFDDRERELRQKAREIDGLEKQLGCINQQLKESELANAQFQSRIAELEQLIKEQRARIKLKWREGEKAPCKMSISYCAAVDDSTLYVRATRQMFSYTISTARWSQLPNSPVEFCPSVIVNNFLTLIGGNLRCDTLTNQLYSLSGESSDRRWTEEFPPMPTKRQGTTALCTGTALIVAGGRDRNMSTLQTVEVLNTETLQWSTAADLPQPLAFAPATICCDHIHLLDEFTMYTCSKSIFPPIPQQRSFFTRLWNRRAEVWKKVAVPPVTETTCVSIHGQLLAIGGKDSDKEPTTAIHMYNRTANSWEVVSHMRTPRWNCIAAVLSMNQLMVIGGSTVGFAAIATDSTEFATVE